MDIDSDIATSIRENVIDYVSQRYAYKKDYWVKELSGTVCSIYTEVFLLQEVLSVRLAA